MKKKYCVNCGEKLIEPGKYCNVCGTFQDNEEEEKQVFEDERKSKIAAGLLGIFLGGLGVHNFYLGYTSKAVSQILLTTVGWLIVGLGPLVAQIWGFIEGIMILAGSIDKDANGVKLKD